MKKAKALTAALVAGLISIGAGYAWWTDALSINSTVQTGNLNLKFVSAAVSHDTTDNNKYLEDGPVVVTDKNVTFSVNNMYPGAVENFTARFVNNGTIPAVVDDINFNSNFLRASNTTDKIDIEGDFVVYDKNNSPSAPIHFKSTSDKINGVLAGVIENKLRVEPQGYVQIEGMKISLNGTAVNSYQTDTLNMNLNLSFKQHNQ